MSSVWQECRRCGFRRLCLRGFCGSCHVVLDCLRDESPSNGQETGRDNA
jgi:hypothetical protein